MNKEEFIKLLREYKENKAKLKIKLKTIKNYRIKLDNLKDYETSLTTKFGINQDIHSKNAINDKVLNKVEENDTKRIEIEEKIEELGKEIRELRFNVEIVEDRLEALKHKECKIVEAYYIDGRTAQNIADNLYKELYGKECSQRYIQAIAERAIQKMLNL